jgi:hypothetical protein
VTGASQIHDAYAALTAAGSSEDEALRCLEVLSEAGFLITRPQHLLDNMVDAALAAAKADQ